MNTYNPSFIEGNKLPAIESPKETCEFLTTQLASTVIARVLIDLLRKDELDLFIEESFDDNLSYQEIVNILKEFNKHTTVAEMDKTELEFIEKLFENEIFSNEFNSKLDELNL
jgi:hypothetical protein